MRRRRREAGFTLIEVIVAVGLSSVVLMGVFSLMTSMVQSEVSGMRDGTVTAWSLANIGAMNNDIPSGSYLSYPNASVGNAADGLVICTNWSQSGTIATGKNPGPISPGTPSYAYEYCYDLTDPPPFQNTILRQIVLIGAGGCPTAPPACTSGNYTTFAGQSAGAAGIVATGVYRLDYTGRNVESLFTVDPNSTNGNGLPNEVDFNCIVGMPKAGFSAGTSVGPSGTGGTYNQTYTAVPQSVTFQTKIILED